MKKYFFFFFLIAISFFSCGPSEEEKATLHKFYTDSLRNTHYLIETYSELVKELKLQLEVENSKMVSIKGYEFLRTEEEKEQQIKNQRERIMEGEKLLLEYEQYVKYATTQYNKIMKERKKYD